MLKRLGRRFTSNFLLRSRQRATLLWMVQTGELFAQTNVRLRLADKRRLLPSAHRFPSTLFSSLCPSRSSSRSSISALPQLSTRSLAYSPDLVASHIRSVLHACSGERFAACPCLKEDSLSVSLAYPSTPLLSCT